MLFEDFQGGQYGGYLGYWNRMILAILFLHVSPMPPTKLGLNLTVQEQMWFQDFQDGHHGGQLG